MEARPFRQGELEAERLGAFDRAQHVEELDSRSRRRDEKVGIAAFVDFGIEDVLVAEFLAGAFVGACLDDFEPCSTAERDAFFGRGPDRRLDDRIFGFEPRRRFFEAEVDFFRFAFFVPCFYRERAFHQRRPAFAGDDCRAFPEGLDQFCVAEEAGGVDVQFCEGFAELAGQQFFGFGGGYVGIGEA
jgi:hypothetical protein